MYAQGLNNFGASAQTQAIYDQPKSLPPRESELPMLMGRLESRLIELRESIEVLERRVEPVSRQMAPAGTSGGVPSEAPGTPMGGQLAAFAQMVDNMATRVRDVVGRLEV